MTKNGTNENITTDATSDDIQLQFVCPNCGIVCSMPRSYQPVMVTHTECCYCETPVVLTVFGEGVQSAVEHGHYMFRLVYNSKYDELVHLSMDDDSIRTIEMGSCLPDYSKVVNKANMAKVANILGARLNKDKAFTTLVITPALVLEVLTDSMDKVELFIDFMNGAIDGVLERSAGISRLLDQFPEDSSLHSHLKAAQKQIHDALLQMSLASVTLNNILKNSLVSGPY